MKEFLEGSVFFGVLLSLCAYGLGMRLKRRFNSPLCNPMLIAMLLTIGFLLLSQVSYESYYQGARYLSYLLTPATVCLAIPLYEKLTVLKRNYRAIILGVGTGVLTSLCSTLLMSRLFALDDSAYATLLPKSVTTAIGIALSEELGGNAAITSAAIGIAGIGGSLLGPSLCRLFRITEPVARGVAMGTASHAIGTARAMEMGEVEGAISSLSLVVAGILTVLAASLFAPLL